MTPGRNDQGPKRPTFLGQNDPPQKLAETTQGRTSLYTTVYAVNSGTVSETLFSLHVTQSEITKRLKNISGLECVTHQRVFEDKGTKEPQPPTHGESLQQCMVKYQRFYQFFVQKGSAGRKVSPRYSPMSLREHRNCTPGSPPPPPPRAPRSLYPDSCLLLHINLQGR